jgi:hypothetical protein
VFVVEGEPPVTFLKRFSTSQELESSSLSFAIGRVADGDRLFNITLLTKTTQEEAITTLRQATSLTKTCLRYVLIPT